MVRGPGDDDCAIWTGAVGADGYGRFWVRRGGTRMMVRADRYALAAALDGEVLESWVRALHGCNNPPCVRVSSPGRQTVCFMCCRGTQRDNMLMMAAPGPRRRPRGGAPRRQWH